MTRLALCGIVSIIATAGLVSTVQAETVTYYQFRTWSVAVPAVVAAAMLIMAAVLFRTKRLQPLAMALLLLSLVPSALIAPGMVINQLKVTPARIEQVIGLRWNPRVVGFDYAHTARVVILDRSSGPGRSPGRVWEIQRNDGEVTEIVPGHLWLVNTEDIVSRLQEYGVDIFWH